VEERVQNIAAAEDATAPETLRQNGPLKDKTLESGLLLTGHQPKDGESPADGVSARVR